MAIGDLFGNVYRGKKVLVTGHTGFKGSWLSVWLLKMGAEVHGISIDIPTNPSMFEVLNLEKHLSHQQADIRDAAAMAQAIAHIKPDFVFHLAAQPIVSLSYSDPVNTMMTNVMGTTHLLEALRLSNHPCTAVMITSDKCYDNVEWIWGYRENDALGGKDPYSASKGAAELVIKTYFHSYFKKESSNVRLASVRAGNVIGGGDWAANRIVPDCVRSWSQRQPVEIRSPRATRPWQHVLEPLSGYLRAAQLLSQKQELNGESYNFGPNSDQNATVLEVLQEVSRHWDFGSQQQKYLINEVSNFHEAGLLKLNCDKALHQLQWKPALNFEQTIRFTAQWYNVFYNAGATDMLDFTHQQIDSYVAQAAAGKNLWAIQQ